jgi:hypothetical protein
MDISVNLFPSDKSFEFVSVVNFKKNKDQQTNPVRRINCVTACMNEPVTAYMDMEFGGVCGTWQRMKLPVEVGVIMHHPECDELMFSERKFSYDIDITVWKNITDELGRTVGKNPCSINPARNEIESGHVKKIRLDQKGRQNAYRISRIVQTDLKDFMRSLNGCCISTMVFFAADYEKTTLAQAGVNLSGFEVHDLQSDLKSVFGLKDVLSLDRLSHIIRFDASEGHISSLHFRYPVPEPYRDRMNPHDSIGDSARIFLASQEFHNHREELGKRIKEYLALCELCSKTVINDEIHARE